MFAIFGSGFGLYGYLPALVELCKEQIVLPTRYRAFFDTRPELQRYAPAITWAGDESEALSVADGVVVALLPQRQVEVAYNCLQRPAIRRLILEKPLAPDPQSALNLLEALEASQKAFRIGYTFRYTGWGNQLLAKRDELAAAEGLSIQWTFMAHHFRYGLDNWKRRVNSGGGALRFYGIHLVAFLAELGYQHVEWSRSCGESESEKEKWNARFAGPNLPHCDVVVDSRSAAERFAVGKVPGPLKDAAVVSLRSPFDENRPMLPSARNLDNRLGVVGALCQSFSEPRSASYGWYKQTLHLWHETESKDVFSDRW